MPCRRIESHSSDAGKERAWGSTRERASFTRNPTTASNTNPITREPPNHPARALHTEPKDENLGHIRQSKPQASRLNRRCTVSLLRPEHGSRLISQEKKQCQGRSFPDFGALPCVAFLSSALWQADSWTALGRRARCAASEANKAQGTRLSSHDCPRIVAHDGTVAHAPGSRRSSGGFGRKTTRRQRKTSRGRKRNATPGRQSTRSRENEGSRVSRYGGRHGRRSNVPTLRAKIYDSPPQAHARPATLLDDPPET